MQEPLSWIISFLGSLGTLDILKAVLIVFAAFVVIDRLSGR